MITQTIDPYPHDLKARQIRTQASTILAKWGLLPRFKRWRLARDPSSGMVVLFGILNNRYIATHTSIPFGDYFDPRLLHDLANELQVQVVSCNGAGLRYAFILDRGQIAALPTHIDFPFLDGDRLFVRVVYGETPAAGGRIPPRMPGPLLNSESIDELVLVRRGVEALLTVFDDVRLQGAVASSLSTPGQLNLLVAEEEEFKQHMAELEAGRQTSKRIRRLFIKAIQ